MHSPITIVLADNHPLIQMAIRDLLAPVPDVELLRVVDDGYEARAACEELDPDILLLDISMPGPPPQETVRRLHRESPRTKVIVLTAYDDDEYALSLSAAGAEGYVLKDEAVDAVIEAIRSVARGNAWYSQRVANKILRHRQRHQDLDLGVLTPREREILAFVTQGWDNQRIAAHLDLAEQTVRNYVSGIYGKVGVTSRDELATWARARGIEEA